jgi:hypothetical protein
LLAGVDAERQSQLRRLVSPAFGCGPSPSSAGVCNHCYPLRRLVIRNPVEQGHGTQSNPLGMKDLWLSAGQFWKIIPDLETVNSRDPDPFRPQNQRLRTQNPEETRPQPPVERGWADQADSRPPLRGPGGWVGDWYLWHAPDGLRARAATGLGCVQADAEKLGVIEASYASAIIGVLSLVSSHCDLSYPKMRTVAGLAGADRREAPGRGWGIRALLQPNLARGVERWSAGTRCRRWGDSRPAGKGPAVRKWESHCRSGRAGHKTTACNSFQKTEVHIR